MQQLGKGSRQLPNVDCGNETTVSCHPTDCRLINVTQGDTTTVFFAALVVVTAFGFDEGCDVSLNNPRGQNKQQYVTLKGLGVVDGDAETKVQTVTIESDNPAELKSSIVATICACLATDIPPTPEPQTADIVIVEDGQEVVQSPQYRKHDGDDVYAFGVRFQKDDPGENIVLTSQLPADWVQSNLISVKVRNQSGVSFGQVDFITGGTGAGDPINFIAYQIEGSPLAIRDLPSGGEIYEVVFEYKKP